MIQNRPQVAPYVTQDTTSVDKSLPGDDSLPDLLRDEPQHVRQSLRALARLLGVSVDRPNRDLKTFLLEHLGVPAAELVSVKADLVGVNAPLVQRVVGALLDRAPDAVIADDTGYGVPGFDVICVAVDEDVAVPVDLAAFLPAAQGLGFDAVLVLTSPANKLQLSIRARRDDRDRARAALAALLKRAKGEDNFFRGKTLQVAATDWEIRFTPVPRRTVTRGDVLHDEAVWRAVDANIGGLARHGKALVAADLGAARGLLITGRPGLGKTALCRVIASELPEGTTIVLVEQGITPFGIRELYDSLESLAPVAVFLDDLDLMAGDRRSGAAGPLLGVLLSKLDGFTPSAPVVTVATTNNADIIDPALVRPGRFDAVVEVTPPSLELRRQILHRYVSPLADLDLTPVAASTEGASGADLREIVRRAVLERGSDLTTEHLQEVVATGRWKPAMPTGQYL